MTAPVPAGELELELELVDPDSVELLRLFGHPGGDWASPASDRLSPRPGGAGQKGLVVPGR